MARADTRRFTGPPTQTLNCGAPSTAQHLAASPNHFCSDVQAQCAATPAAQPADPKITTLAYLQQNPTGGWQLNGFNCAAGPGVTPPPTVTPFDAYAQIVKLVPTTLIGAAPGRGQTLVNIQTIFWVDTAADQNLGTVTLLGHQVGLRIHARGVQWDFGDGQVGTANDLGRPYNSADGCSSPQCPGYFGHEYTRTGQLSVRAAVTWNGQFTVDGGPWRDVANPANGATTVTGPTAATAVRVLQARGVLVPDQ